MLYCISTQDNLFQCTRLTDWRRVAKCLSKIALDVVLRLEVQLLKQLRGDRDAHGWLDVLHLAAVEALSLVVGAGAARHVETMTGNM